MAEANSFDTCQWLTLHICAAKLFVFHLQRMRARSGEAEARKVRQRT
jgi:hypothetical protein